MAAVVAAAPLTARAECRCVAIAGDVAANLQAEVAKADGLYARGDYSGALAIYAKLSATAKEPSLLYAEGMCQWQLGATAEAKAKFQAYLAAGGTLAYKDRAEAHLRDLGAGVGAAVGTAVGVGGAVVGGVAGVGGAVAGSVGAHAEAPKEKIGHTAGIVLGVIAVAAIGTVAIHSIAAGVSTSADFDPKFDIGLGIAGVSVGITAFYVAGLTAATATAAGVCGAQATPVMPAGKPVVAPMALHGGGGLAAALTF